MLQAALGVLTEGVVSSVADLAQSQLHQNEQINEARKAYRLSLFALALDILSKCREEVKDLFESYSNRIDNYMVVHTLLLSLGFAALQYSDSMMPSPQAHPGMLFIFISLFALSMVMPFFSVVALLRVRTNLNHWCDDIMKELNREMTLGFHYVERNGQSRTSQEHSAESVQIDLIKELGGLLSRCSESCDKMWRQRCKKWYDLAGHMFWICLVMNLMLVGIMMGNYFDFKYEEKWITPYFGTLLIVGAVASSIFLCPMRVDHGIELQTPLLQREAERVDVD